MTVTPISNHAPQRFIGLSSDTKPTATTTAIGSAFYETDTGITYLNDGTSWLLDFRETGTGIRTFALLDAIVTILGGTQQSFWPLTDPARSQAFPYGAGNDAGPLVINTSTIELVFSPEQLAPGIYAYKNDSTTANMAAADDADYSFGDASEDGPFSAGIWIKMNEALGTLRSLIAKYGTTATLREWDFRFNSSGQLVLELYDESVDKTEIATGAGGTVLQPFIWQFCVVTYDGGETDPRIHLYINASDQNAAGLSVEDAGYIAMENTACVLMVGARDAAATAENVFQGRYALPFVTGKELTQAEVTALYGYGRALLGV